MPNEPTDAQWRAIETEIFAGRKISAIKLYRSATGLDLKDSKDAIERYKTELRKQFPDKAPAARKGCGAAVLLLIVGTTIILFLA